MTIELRPIWGCAAIAKAIGKSERSTFHLLEAGRLPARKIGRQWVSTEQALRQAIEIDPAA